MSEGESKLLSCVAGCGQKNKVECSWAAHLLRRSVSLNPFGNASDRSKFIKLSPTIATSHRSALSHRALVSGSTRACRARGFSLRRENQGASIARGAQLSFRTSYVPASSSSTAASKSLSFFLHAGLLHATLTHKQRC